MEVIDAVWEIRNLGKKTVEVIFDNKDIEKPPSDVCNIAKKIEEEYSPQYMVVKIPTGNPWIGNELRCRGFDFIEMQIYLRVNKRDVNQSFKKYGHLFKNAAWRTATQPEDMEYIQSEIRKGIFFTDRIALDKNFGVKIANERYARYVEDAIDHGAELFYVLVGEEKIGFFLDKYNGNSCKGILGGLFLSAQNKNLGSIQYYLEFDKAINYNACSNFFAVTSSNNVTALRAIEFFGGKINMLQEVYIKHYG